MSWATLTDVQTITGRTDVTAPTLAMASAVIEIYSNRTQAASGAISARDTRWLVQAECWQAAWLANQFGYDSRIAAESVTQDGVIVQHRSQSEEDLAPLAARALKNLSWKGSRVQRTPSSRRPTGVPGVQDNGLIDYLQESTDSLGAWSPM